MIVQNMFLGTSVVEIGCGTGICSRLLAEMCNCVIATDYKQSILDIASVSLSTQDEIQKNIPNTHSVQFRLLNLLDDSAYDVIEDSMHIDFVFAGDMVYDEVLTENLCRVGECIIF